MLGLASLIGVGVSTAVSNRMMAGLSATDPRQGGAAGVGGMACTAREGRRPERHQAIADKLALITQCSVAATL